jgi:hypothetical protein
MTAANGARPSPFRHEALMYAGAEDFVAQAAPIVAGAVEAGDPVLVAVDAAKIELLRDRLGGASRSVAWKDIRGIGGNPARIIPLWRQFVAGHASHDRLLGFGEPIWPGRAPAELIEAQRHEQLLNLAFADTANFTLLCPYDTEALHRAVLHEGHRSHPFIAEGGNQTPSADYSGLDAMSAPFAASLPEPAEQPSELVMDGLSTAGLRGLLADAGLAAPRADDLVFAIAAVAHGMGRPGAGPSVRMWWEAASVTAEIDGLVAADDPLAGREWPPPAEGGARGLWLANQLCDLVQLRSSRAGAFVRLHVSR